MTCFFHPRDSRRLASSCLGCSLTLVVMKILCQGEAETIPLLLPCFRKNILSVLPHIFFFRSGSVSVSQSLRRACSAADSTKLCGFFPPAKKAIKSSRTSSALSPVQDIAAVAGPNARRTDPDGIERGRRPSPFFFLLLPCTLFFFPFSPFGPR